MLEYIINHIQELITASTLGGGAGFTANKLIRKNQTDKINKLEKRMNQLEQKTSEISTQIKTNYILDEGFRKQVEKDYNEIKKEINIVKQDLKDDMNYVKNNIGKIVDHLLNKS